ncbi:MAG: NAD-glutamate dehydrogenase [Rhodoferax sp.]
MNESLSSALFEATVTLAGADDPVLVAFVQAYFEGADPEILSARDPRELVAMAQSHLRLLSARHGAPLPRVRVFNPSLAEDGFETDCTVLQVVQDDMPFLVDTVTMAVNRSGRMAHWVVHPLLRVQIDDQGRLLHCVPASRASGPGSVVSMIRIECERIVTEAERDALAQDVRRVLDDVRAVVQDWSPMLERLDAAIADQPHDEDPVVQWDISFLQWLKDRHFTFLGARDYAVVSDAQGIKVQAIPDTGLGLLRGRARTPVAYLPELAQAFVRSQRRVWVTKAMTRSTVHRPAWLDCLSIKRLNPKGDLVGELRLLGLFTSKAYAQPVSEIPLLRERAEHVMRSAAVVPESHAAKALQAILDAYPRDELFQIDNDTLLDHALGILRLQERQRTRVFLRHDPFGRFASAQVFVPRDRYNTELRVRIGQELAHSLAASVVEFTPTLTDSPMARIHYMLRSDAQPGVTNPDLPALEQRVARLARRWEDDLALALIRSLGESEGQRLALRLCNAFPALYRDHFTAAAGAQDAVRVQRLLDGPGIDVALYRSSDAMGGAWRFKIFSRSKVALSDSLPILENLGLRVLDEQPYPVALPEGTVWIHDMGLQWPEGVEVAQVRTRFETLFLHVWQGQLDSDGLNRLVLLTDLDGADIAVLRAYARYFRQIGFGFSQNYIQVTLAAQPALTQALMRYFSLRFDPDFEGDRAQALAEQVQRVEQGLAGVQSLDEDRILRQFYAAIGATLRTNAFQTPAQPGQLLPYLSFKLDSRQIPGVPDPKPMVEIWVYAPRFEAVHLRNGRVARGGLRWSDRPEDFRTEILGLVKAQQVKNTVIVPVGSKGGFVLKRLSATTDRDALLAQAQACYTQFLSGMLDLTDNLRQGQTVPPARVVCYDAPDPYLVVAADKGTATFSDLANNVSQRYGFWLGDAFASGGSVGYDHKKMGITARGAWESAKRHFRAMGCDIQTQPFTVVGIGDMSGDVFGNGMLLSPCIRLVAAFDHRHIFIDPDPDPVRTLAERRRLFALPRSSWDDFDRGVISQGGGVYPRSAKSIALSEPARRALGIDAESLPPDALLHAILQAPVDMIYNGGIGTYVKASSESHAQVGDKAGDAYRVDGAQLRCKAFVEGGNLGCTQLGRVEFALRGGRIYTDAIDNSAGVDCSDHEVNIKILLDRVVEAGDLTLKQRNALLAEMTEDVARLVLQDNYYQTQALDLAAHRALYVLDAQQRLMRALESSGRLNRALEFLPSDATLAQRRGVGQGLTSPEAAVLMAYAKMALFDDLLASDLPDDAYFERALQAYFPSALWQRFGAEIVRHPLKREIIATALSNSVINRMGATFVHFLVTESAASSADVVRAYALAREVFGLEALWDRIDALDGQVDNAIQLDGLAQLARLTQRAARWMLRRRDTALADLTQSVARYQSVVRSLRAELSAWLTTAQRQQWADAAARLAHTGLPADLAQDLAALEYVFPALDLVALCSAQSHEPLERVARAYFVVREALNAPLWLDIIGALPTQTLWQVQARASARDDLAAALHQVTAQALAQGGDVQEWVEAQAPRLASIRALAQEIQAQGADLAALTVGLRELKLIS